MMNAAPYGRYFCEACLSRYHEEGDCPSCPEEPLLDLWNPEVMEMLRKFDELAWRERMGQVTAVCAVICSPSLITWFFFAFLAMPLFGGLTMGLSAIVYPFFKARKVTPDRVAPGPRTRKRGASK